MHYAYVFLNDIIFQQLHFKGEVIEEERKKQVVYWIYCFEY